MEFIVLLVPLMFLAIGLLGTVFWIWMIVDCLSNESSEGNDKLIWMLVIVLTHLLGALIYFLVRRPQRISQLGR
ncbi:MAG TPA: PLD nuclease N-terminal domain-containing protein [Thermoguttaceae bacterium]|nr:PLD nuclease N-terminal domain-containing protein [Thermoguttaceae bacterium]